MLYHPNTSNHSGNTSGFFISTLAAAITNNCGWTSTYQKKYHNGNYQIPQVNDTVYNNSTLTTAFTGHGGGYWKIQGTHYSIKINSSTGNVDEVIDCNTDFSGYTAFSFSDSNSTNSGIACSSLYDWSTHYHDGSGDYPVVGDTIYYLLGDVMTALTGFNDKWFTGVGEHGGNPQGAYAYELDGNGEVTSIVYCSCFFC